MNPILNINCENIIQEVFDKLKIEKTPEINITISLEELNSNSKVLYCNYNPLDSVYYPASLLKLFAAFLAKFKLQQNLKDLIKTREPTEKEFGTRTIIDDVYDAIAETLRFSDNDALGFLVDFITETSSGTRLQGKDYELFKAKRTSIEEFFKSRSYTNTLRLRNKCFSFAPYGRDRQLVFEDGNEIKSNQVTIEDISKIFRDIKLNYPELYEFMKRDINNTDDEQVRFIAAGLNECKDHIKGFYSKAGWTSKVRHDGALIKFDNNKEYLFIIMTKGLSNYPELIPELSRKIFICLL